jgi:hypothetical protein
MLIQPRASVGGGLLLEKVQGWTDYAGRRPTRNDEAAALGLGDDPRGVVCFQLGPKIMCN